MMQELKLMIYKGEKVDVECNRVRKQVKYLCEVVAYAMHSSGKISLAVELSPYTFP